MITKERLEVLLEEDKVFYWVFNKEINMLHKLSMPSFWKRKWEFYSKDCFETKEDAEEYAEFGNITRTERLELNNYETFLKSNTGTMFYLNACEYLLHKVRHSADDENPDWRVEVCVFYNDLEESSEVLYSKPLTRENYNEARRLCVKLFKGETDG